MKTVRTETVGKATLRLVETKGTYVGLIFTGGVEKHRVEGADAKKVWQELRREAGRASATYVGFDEARRLFLQHFPDGFLGGNFDAIERDYKLAAKAKLDAAAPVEQAASGSGFAEAALAAIRATNLIYPVEKARAQEMLRGPLPTASCEPPRGSRLVTALPRSTKWPMS